LADEVFGSAMVLARRYVALLAGPGVERGVIGPREPARLWTRHLLNSAALAEFVPAGADVVDVGSGAGLPGIPLALARPDLHITLLEPMARRVSFLDQVVAELGLATVQVRRGRAEDVAARSFDVAVARALAPLDRLMRMTLPMLRPGGRLVALKGQGAADEIEAAKSVIAPGRGVTVSLVHSPVGEEIATVVIAAVDADE
jgi:16S rRNA (guanine527-N7)-methyltransferase